MLKKTLVSRPTGDICAMGIENTCCAPAVRSKDRVKVTDVRLESGELIGVQEYGLSDKTDASEW